MNAMIICMLLVAGSSIAPNSFGQTRARSKAEQPQLVRTYDASTNLSTLEATAHCQTQDGKKFDVGVTATFDGNGDPNDIKAIRLSVVTDHVDWGVKQDAFFLADGQPILIRATGYDLSFKGVQVRTEEISFIQLFQLTNAAGVHGLLGDHPFHMTAAHQAQLDRLTNFLAPYVAESDRRHREQERAHDDALKRRLNEIVNPTMQFGLTPDQRKALFIEVMSAIKQAAGNFDKERENLEAVASRHNLDRDTLTSIKIEGIGKDWPKE